jgi:hypothetical protein
LTDEPPENITNLFGKKETKIKVIDGGEGKFKTDPQVAAKARELLEKEIAEGAVSFVILAEKDDGFTYRPAPESMWVVIGAIDCVYHRIQAVLKSGTIIS